MSDKWKKIIKTNAKINSEKNSNLDSVWEQFYDGVVPLKNRNKYIQPTEKITTDLFVDKKYKKSKQLNLSEKQNLMACYLGYNDKPFRKGKITQHYKKNNNSHNSLKTSIDLHLLSLDEAYNKLLKFIKETCDNKYPCAVVITGKGMSRPRKDSYMNQQNLQREVPFWLTNKKFSKYVISFQTTHDKGALILQLNTKK